MAQEDRVYCALPVIGRKSRSGGGRLATSPA
jgi:hypothetical protein